MLDKSYLIAYDLPMTYIDTRSHRTRPGPRKGWRKGFSKMVLRRLDDTRALAGSIEVFKARVADGLGQRLAPGLAEGEVLPDFALSLDLVGRSVEREAERLRAAERGRIERGSECAAVRRRSVKVARREVYPRVVSVRRQIDAQLGKEDGRNVHRMVGKTLRKPRRLYGQLQVLMWALEEDAELPPPLLAGYEKKREDWLREVEPGYRQLTELLGELESLEMLEQAAKDEKQEAMQAFDAAYGEALRLLQASFAFAGLHDTLTGRLRSYFQHRLLIRRAREKRQARAEGRIRQTLRSAASSVLGFLDRGPRNVA